MTLYASPLFLQHPTGPATVDADLIRVHLTALSKAGVGYRRAARLAGVPLEFVRSILFGRRTSSSLGLPRRVARDKANLILAVTVTPDVGALVNARGARRRVQALIVAGWSQAKIADQLGMSIKVFGRVLRQEQVRAGTHFAIANLFEDLWDAAPPLDTAAERAAASRARSYARALDWAPALAWDDIDTDDEPALVDNVVPFDDVAVDLACDGYNVPLTRLERLSAIRVLHTYKLSDSQIAETLHVTDQTVLRNRRMLGLPGNLDARQQVVFA